jgi:PKHD-type hydroxylase
MHNYLSIGHNLQTLLQNSKEIEGPYIHYLKSENYYIHTYRHSVFSNSELDQIITLGKRSSLVEAGVGPNSEVLEHIRISSLSWMGPTPSRQWLFDRLTNCILSQNEEFYKYDLDFIEMLQFTHYKSEQKGFYTKHIDSHIEHWHPPHNRKLSFVVQLSDPSEYEGGDLTIYTTPDGTKVPKDRGLVHFFPSHCLHEVTPVTAGERYSLVGWVHGAPLK